MKVDKRLLPIKAHFFFFMAASGPILPYLTVYGKELGVSEVLMGSITAVVPLAFLLAKPAFGFLADYFYDRRKLIFMGLITSMTVFYLCLYFVPAVNVELKHFRAEVNATGFPFCDELEDGNETVKCNASCSAGCNVLGLEAEGGLCFRSEGDGCDESGGASTECEESCFLQQADGRRLLRSFEFYAFVFLMAASSIAFNVGNSISDAICFDVLGQGGEDKYGYQRAWGTVGFGATALLGGLGMDLWSGGGVKNYAPAFALVFVFACIDLFCCTKLKERENEKDNDARRKLPKMEMSKNIIKDLSKVLKHKFISVFLVFAILAGILDGFIIYFLFWFLEDLVKGTGDESHVKVLEGLTVALETLGGELLFFPLSGKIINKIGYGHSMSLCFFNYALRLGSISLVSDPRWILAIELLGQGPTYALCYATIVAYANAVSPPGTSATMQGIVAGMDDGFGYALGSLTGGLLYGAVGGRWAFRVFSILAVICCIAHLILYKCVTSKSYEKYRTTERGEAFQMVRTNANHSSNATCGVNS